MLNWRDPGEYAYTENLTLPQWAWEFLRRSHAYRALWQAIQDYWAELDRQGVQEGDSVTIPVGLFTGGAQFGLENHMPGPDVRADELPNLQWEIGVNSIKKVYPDEIPRHPAAVRFIFDISVPLEGQIARATRELRLLQQEYRAAGHPIFDTTIRVRKDAWVNYIRLLDAKLAGESISEMGRVIYADTSDQRGNAQNALRKAEEMAESGYRQLLFTHDPSVPHARPKEPPVRTRLVRVLLGADWGENHSAGETVEVDSVRGDWLLENLPGSRLIE
jgi:hypothetical protein